MTPKKNRRRSMRQERELAEDTGARVQPGSGAIAGIKGDVRSRGNFRAECKFTRANSYRVDRKTLDKISSECSFGEIPILDISFIARNGQTEDRWVAMPYSDWITLNAAGKHS